MKNTSSAARSLVTAAFVGLGICVFVGILVSFRLSETVFKEAADIVRNLSFEGADFLPTLKKAVLTDMIFCVPVLFMSPGLVRPLFVGVATGAKGFFVGAASGLAAKCLQPAQIARVCGAVFASNFLVLPIYVLLFVSAVEFARDRGTKPSEKGGFEVKVIVFFSLMCLAQLVQTAIGLCVINIGR